MKLISRTAAAKLLGCHPQTVSNYAKQGLIDEVRRENEGRVTLFYYEEQLQALIPDLHELEDLKGRILAEKELLRQDLANLSSERNDARRNHLKINGGKKTLAHLRELIVAAYTFVQKTTPVAKEKFEEEILDGLLTGKTVEEIVADTKSTQYRVEKAVRSIAQRMLQVPSLIKENARLQKEVERLEKHNKMLQATTDFRVQPQKVTITRVTTSGSGADTKREEEPLSADQFKTTSVDNLGLSDSVKAGLKFNNIHTLYDLLGYKERELSDMKKIGIERASEINTYLVRLGLSLGMAQKKA